MHSSIYHRYSTRKSVLLKSQSPKILLFILVLLTLSATCPSASSAQPSRQHGQELGENALALTSLPPQYTGVWKGQEVATYSDGSTIAWSFILSFVDGSVGSVVGTLANTTSSCGATLTLLQVNSNSIQLAGEGSYGNCLSSDHTITLLANDSIQYTLVNQSVGVHSTGTGSRVSGPGTKIPSNYSGIWQGSAIQSNPAIQWTALFGITNGELGSIVGTSAYPSLDCGGELTLTNVTTDSIEVSQNILYGNCLNSIITLKLLNTDNLDARWVATGDPSITSAGTLMRISAAPWKSWTLMYYIAADNDATQETRLQAQYDFLKGTSKNPNVNVVAFWDGLKLKDTKYVAWVSSNETSNIGKEELNTGDPATLHDFVTWAQQNYPASHYALIISDHGSLSGVASDVTANFLLGDYLTQNDLLTALSGVEKLDIVYMDACLMGNIETAYQLRDIADYYVASESETWNGILPQLYTLGSKQVPGLEKYDISGIASDTSPEQLAINIGKSSDVLGKYFWQRPSTISTTKLSNVTDVAARTSILAGLLKGNMDSLHGILESITPYNVLQHYEMDGDNEITNKDQYVDLYQFAELVQTNIHDSNIQSAAQELITSIDNYVIYEDHWSGSFTDKNRKNHYWYHANSHGVSIFFTPFSRSFYKDGWSDFTSGTTWNISDSQTMLTLPNSAPTIEWGPMLVEYVRDTNPNALDNPNPPQLLAPQMGYYFISLPMLRR